MRRDFYIYAHFIGSETLPFYVGKGTGNRLNDKRRNNYWHKIVNKYGNLQTIKILDNLTEKEAFKLEVDLISKNYPRANMTAGGEGMSGFSPSKETRLKQRNAKLGKKLTKEHIKNVSNATKGRKLTKEHKKNIKQSKLGNKNPAKIYPEKYKNIGKNLAKSNIGKKRQMTEKMKNICRINGKNRSIKVKCIELDITFDSVQDALKYLKVTSNGINHVINGRNKTAYGYHWERLDDSEKNKKYRPCQQKSNQPHKLKTDYDRKRDKKVDSEELLELVEEEVEQKEEE